MNLENKRNANTLIIRGLPSSYNRHRFFSFFKIYFGFKFTYYRMREACGHTSPSMCGGQRRLGGLRSLPAPFCGLWGSSSGSHACTSKSAFHQPSQPPTGPPNARLAGNFPQPGRGFWPVPLSLKYKHSLLPQMHRAIPEGTAT